MSYVSDSAGKSLVRARMWMHLSQWLQIMGQPMDGALVLAGHGGDLSSLQVHTDLERVTAVDIDPDCAWYCSELYPRANVQVGDVSRVCKDRSTPVYNAAHIDFCSGLSVENLKSILDVVTSPRAGKILALGVTMMKGREHLPKGHAIHRNMSRAERRRAIRFARKKKTLVGTQILQGEFDPRLAIDRAMDLCKQVWQKNGRESTLWTRNGNPRPLAHSMARAAAIRYSIQRMLDPLGMDIFLGMVMGYHSRSSQSGGSPMMTACYLIGPAINRDQRHILASTLSYYCNLTSAEAEKTFRPTVIHWARVIGTDQASKMFDVEPGKIRAWLAHDSRGTYADDAEPFFSGAIA